MGRPAFLDPSKIAMASRTREVQLGPGPLPLEEFVAVARHGAKVSFSEDYLVRVTRSRQLAEKFLAENRVIYGLTTGFGDNVRNIVPPEQAVQLQYNILRSHAVSVGDPLPAEAVRAIWLMQLLSLGQGFSGIRPGTLGLIAGCLNKNVVPYTPGEGSVQALAVEAQMNLVLVGEGKAWFDGKLLTGREALEAAGLVPMDLACKEGLCLTNGSNSATGVAALALYDLLVAVQEADVAAAMTYEALRGNILACDARLHSLKAHPEQAASASNLRRLLFDSGIVARHRGGSVQDPYVLRCTPHVHGASKRFVKDAAGCILEEMASCSDNPVLWPEGEDGLALMGGNFDSTFASGAADILCVAAANLGKLQERRLDRMTNRYFSGYPAFLAVTPGVDNGYMIVQYTAAGLVNEIRGLCLPSTADSIPTCANWEDPVSMGWWASRKAWLVGKKLQYILAMELMAAARALDMTPPEEGTLASATKAVRDRIREVVPPVTGDRHFGPDIEVLFRLVSEGEILRVAESVSGTLDL